jgi:hypothetical protein
MTSSHTALEANPQYAEAQRRAQELLLVRGLNLDARQHQHVFRLLTEAWLHGSNFTLQRLRTELVTDDHQSLGNKP